MEWERDSQRRGRQSRISHMAGWGPCWCGGDGQMAPLCAKIWVSRLKLPQQWLWWWWESLPAPQSLFLRVPKRGDQLNSSSPHYFFQHLGLISSSTPLWFTKHDLTIVLGLHQQASLFGLIQSVSLYTFSHNHFLLEVIVTFNDLSVAFHM